MGMAFHCATAATSPFSSLCLLRHQHRRHHRALRVLAAAAQPHRWCPVDVWRQEAGAARGGVRAQRGNGAAGGVQRGDARPGPPGEGQRGRRGGARARLQGFPSSLSGRTAPDPAMSVLPERAIIQSVDVVKGPFDPSDIEYLEKDFAWDDFKSRLQ